MSNLINKPASQNFLLISEENLIELSRNISNIILFQILEKVQKKFIVKDGVNMTQINNDCICIKKAAKVLDISERTLRRYCKNGKIKFTMVGGNIRILKSVVNEYINQNTILLN